MSIQPRVLVVDDEPDTCSGLRRILQLDGYDVEIAHSFAKLFKPRDWAAYFAIILDRKLLDGTAEEFIPKIRELAPRASIVIVTGYADIESSIAVMCFGLEDYIIKPINPDALRSTLARVNRLRQAEDRALQAERLAAIGQVVTSMAHESRNFLQRIGCAVELLGELEKDNPEALDEIDRIHAAQQGLAHLLEELRQFAAPLRLNQARHSVQEVWKEAWSDATMAMHAENAQIEQDVGELDLHCYVDAFRLRQVFCNLFENSIAACNDAVQIQIECHNGNGTLHIAVRDNGPGLSREQQQRVFEPFFTTKTEGTGLGMAISKRIVEAHGGEINVESEVGKGTTISLMFPQRDREHLPHTAG